MRLGSLLLLVGLLAACDDRTPPTQPTPNNSPPVSPSPSPSPSQPVLAALRVEGPATVPPGENAGYSATAVYRDGSSRDVTSEARWTSTDDSVLLVTSPGVVAGRSNGEAEIRAAYANTSHGRRVVVVPSGQYVLRASVHDGQVPTSPIFAARVEVIGGPAAGLAATTDWYGLARLFGVPADVEVRVSKEGYESTVQSLRLSTGGQARIELSPSRSRADLSGSYHLTITSGSCSGDGALPEAATSRTYSASIWEPGGKVRVQLSGATFPSKVCPGTNCFGGDGSSFTGENQASETRFELREYVPDWDWNAGIYPDVAERLADGTLLTVSGRAIVTPSADGLSGTLDGSISIFDSLPLSGEGGRLLASCRSTSHRFTLVR